MRDLKVIAIVIYLLFSAAFVVAADYNHHYIQKQTYGFTTEPAKVDHAKILADWHRKNFAWVQVGRVVSSRPAPKGLGPGKWVAYGVWEQRKTTWTWRQECRNGVCRMYRVPAVSRIRHKIDVRRQASLKKAERKTRPQIRPARRTWVYYGGDSGQRLINHIVSDHQVTREKLAGLTDTELRRIHSRAHEGTLDSYWRR